MSLLTHYPLNGDTTDASGNGLDGTPTDVSWVAGKIGQAGSFNGTTSKSVTTQNITSAQFSIALWFYCPTIVASANDPLFVKWNAGANKRSWILALNHTGTGNVMFMVSDKGWNYICKRSANSVFTAAAWHYLVATYNAGTFSLDIDGTSVGLSTYTSTGTVIGAPHSNDAEARLGSTKHESGAERFGAVILDDVRVYDEVLPTWKIKALYNGGRGSEECEPWQRLVQRTVQPTIRHLVGV